MTTELLSARIAALEQRAAQAQSARWQVNELLASIADLQGKLQEAQAAIQDGEYAERILGHLASQAERVLTSGELMRASGEASDAAPSPAEPATPAPDPLVPAENNRQRVLGTLQGIGYAVPASALFSRLKAFMSHTELDAILAMLLSQQAITRQPDGKYGLPNWSQR